MHFLLRFKHFCCEFFVAIYALFSQIFFKLKSTIPLTLSLLECMSHQLNDNVETMNASFWPAGPMGHFSLCTHLASHLQRSA